MTAECIDRLQGACRTFGIIALVAVAGAQQAAQPSKDPAVQSDEPTRIQVDVTRVNMLFTVTDKKGRFITDLNKEDFDVVENRIPQVIQEFTSETGLPLRLGILMDTSGSIRDRFRFEQQAAIEFLTSVVHKGQDRALVISFDTRIELVADLTDDLEKVTAAIRGLRSGGGTALYDAIYFACRDKLQEQPRDKFRRALVILSDGDDNHSRYTRDQALEMAHKADVVVYGISTNVSRLESKGDKVMKYFSQETGGRAFFPFKVTDLDQSFDDIADELRHQYNITYRPEPLRTDGQFHVVDLRVKMRKDLVVRARKGYYAPRF